MHSDRAMKRLLSVLPVFVVCAVVALAHARQAQAARTPPVVYVSLQRIINEGRQEKADTARLQAMQQQKALDIKSKQEALEAARLELAQAGGVFKASTRTRLQREEQERRADLEKATREAQTELQALQRQLQNDLKARLGAVLNELARRDAVQLVLNQDTGVLWSAPGTDVTAEVIERLNALAPPAPSK